MIHLRVFILEVNITHAEILFEIRPSAYEFAASYDGSTERNCRSRSWKGIKSVFDVT